MCACTCVCMCFFLFSFLSSQPSDLGLLKKKRKKKIPRCTVSFPNHDKRTKKSVINAAFSLASFQDPLTDRSNDGHGKVERFNKGHHVFHVHLVQVWTQVFRLFHRIWLGS